MPLIQNTLKISMSLKVRVILLVIVFDIQGDHQQLNLVKLFNTHTYNLEVLLGNKYLVQRFYEQYKL